MKIREFLSLEIKGFNLFEKIFFPIEILLIITITIYIHGSLIALVSAIAGISYTILAGKGKISCYFIGITGTFCYCYISYKNGFYGNLALYGLYFLPMQIIGIFKWAKNLKKDTNEIIKTQLTKKEKIIYLIITTVLTIFLGIILKLMGGQNPFVDSAITILSIFGQLLTVKRCIEQWYIWFVVNLLAFIMWLFVCINDTKYTATVIMWGTYIFLAIYFLYKWQKELKDNKTISNVDKI